MLHHGLASGQSGLWAESVWGWAGLGDPGPGEETFPEEAASRPGWGTEPPSWLSAQAPSSLPHTDVAESSPTLTLSPLPKSEWDLPCLLAFTSNVVLPLWGRWRPEIFHLHGTLDWSVVKHLPENPSPTQGNAHFTAILKSLVIMFLQIMFLQSHSACVTWITSYKICDGVSSPAWFLY